MGGMTMSAQEEIKAGHEEVGVGSEGEKGKARQLKTPVSSWQIMQAINRLEHGMRSDSLSREIGGIRQELRDDREKTDNKIEALRLEVKTEIGGIRQELRDDREKTDNKIEALRLEVNGDIDKLGAKFDKVIYWAIGLIVTAILAAGYIGHR